MKVLWAVLCQGSAVDQETNNVSLYNILEQLDVPEPPAEPPDTSTLRAALRPLELFILFSRTVSEVPEAGRANVRLIFPSDDPPASFQIDVDLSQAHRHRVRINLPGMPVSGEGEYLFVVEALGDDGDSIPLFEIPFTVAYQVQEFA